MTQRVATGLMLVANGAWTPTTIVGGTNDGHQINAVPRGTAYGALIATPGTGTSLEAGVRYVGRQWLDKDNQHPLSDFATAELAGTLHFARLRTTLRIANLLDRKVVDSGYIGAIGEERFLPAPGRSASLAVSFD